MSKVIDLTGQEFGQLTVIERAENSKAGKARWKCKCSCGNETTVVGSDLRNQKVKSCGCQRNAKFKEGNFIDLTNQKVGRLTILYPSKEQLKSNRIYWHCKCDCGNETDVLSTHLNDHSIQSCGCLRRDKRIEANHKLHFIDLTNKRFGLLIVLSELQERTSDGKRQWKCLCDCGKIINVETYDLTSGNKKSCGCLRMSKPELKINELLTNNNIDFIQEYKPKDSSISFDARFDFYIPSLNTLIEYDGEQHFFPNEHFGGEEEFKVRKAHDKEKNEWAHNHGITLIRIPYTHYDSLCIKDLMPTTSDFILHKKIKYISKRREDKA